MQAVSKGLTRRHVLSAVVGVAASTVLPAIGKAQGMAPVIRLPADVTVGSQATVRRVTMESQRIALTFDDGPHPRLTPVLLDLLKARNVKATFYVIGRNVARFPLLTKRIADEGHEIGNHTYNHPYLTTLGEEGLLQELDRTTLAVFEATGRAPVTMRPPYGALGGDQRKMVYQARGLPTILWSVDPQDWSHPGSQVVATRIVEGGHRGGIVLAHDIHADTVRAIPSALDGLLARGFQFDTLSEMLGWPTWQTRKFQIAGL